jgi:hypothetical protein
VSIGWSRKQTRRVAQERNADLRDFHHRRLSEFSSYHLDYVDESGCDKRVGIRRTGWSPRGTGMQEHTLISVHTYPLRVHDCLPQRKVSDDGSVVPSHPCCMSNLGWSSCPCPSSSSSTVCCCGTSGPTLLLLFCGEGYGRSFASSSAQKESSGSEPSNAGVAPSENKSSKSPEASIALMPGRVIRKS